MSTSRHEAPGKLNWDASTDDYLKINRVAGRLLSLLPRDLPTTDTRGKRDHQFTEVCMDLTATHLNGCPLDLDALLAMDDSNFLHDVAGIRRHLDRRTGQLTGEFRPRCARREG